jgi:hypothetical protein
MPIVITSLILPDQITHKTQRYFHAIFRRLPVTLSFLRLFRTNASNFGWHFAVAAGDAAADAQRQGGGERNEQQRFEWAISSSDLWSVQRDAAMKVDPMALFRGDSGLESLTNPGVDICPGAGFRG